MAQLSGFLRVQGRVLNKTLICSHGVVADVCYGKLWTARETVERAVEKLKDKQVQT